MSARGASDAAPGPDVEPALRLRGLRKAFGPVVAVEEVNLDVYPGEVVALVGDNGAGKSTLIKIVAGADTADQGEIWLAGTPVQMASPQQATELGVAAVYQDLALCDNLDVVANLFLGQERTRGRTGALDSFAMEAQARALLDELGVRTLRSVNTEVGLLSGGQRQTVAIARAMLGEPRIVLLDEPTASLGVAQTQHVLSLIRRLRDAGVAIVLVSHNLADVLAVADRVHVLRLGRSHGDYDAHPSQQEPIVAAITGAGDASNGAVGPG